MRGPGDARSRPGPSAPAAPRGRRCPAPLALLLGASPPPAACRCHPRRPPPPCETSARRRKRKCPSDRGCRAHQTPGVCPPPHLPRTWADVGRRRPARQVRHHVAGDLVAGPSAAPWPVGGAPRFPARLQGLLCSALECLRVPELRGAGRACGGAAGHALGFPELSPHHSEAVAHPYPVTARWGPRFHRPIHGCAVQAPVYTCRSSSGLAPLVHHRSSLAPPPGPVRGCQQRGATFGSLCYFPSHSICPPIFPQCSSSPGQAATGLGRLLREEA